VTTRRTILKGIGATLALPTVSSASHRRDLWKRALRNYLIAQREHATRYLRRSPGYVRYMSDCDSVIDAVDRYESEPVRAVAPLQWAIDLSLHAADAQLLAECMRAWPGTSIPAYQRAFSCPYTVALLLVQHEIAWTELEDSPSLIWLDMQAKRRTVLPGVAKKMAMLVGRSLSLRGVSILARGHWNLETIAAIENLNPRIAALI
jgi:hypothetical protein